MVKNKIFEKLAKFRRKKTIIFGTSDEGRLTFNILLSYNVKAIAFIDNNLQKIGNQTFGIDILHPDTLKNMENFIVIVPSIYYKPMYQQLMDMKIPKKIILNLDIYDKANIKYDIPYKLWLYLFLNKFFKN